MSELIDAVANNVRKLRESRGLSLSQLSELSGVAKATLFKVERGRTNPTLDTLAAIAETFDVSVPSLVTMPSGAVVEIVKDGEGDDISDEISSGQVLRSLTIGAGSMEIHAQRFFDGKVETSPSHGYGAREHVFVRKGKIVVGPVGEEVEVSAGDYVTYPADRTHKWQAVGGDASIWIVHTFPRAATFLE